MSLGHCADVPTASFTSTPPRPYPRPLVSLPDPFFTQVVHQCNPSVKIHKLG